ncbi:septum formation initiator family protein [Abyssibacter profundi]|uniref:Cell division protein FtsB n=1 Tax=Abyssibacter profundi TaxID=2182787 RepID=A0A363UPI1_9GAMM|nr:septum formation initiator family protein [Abyssibacter profundi]MBV62690.1 cell division protein FtsB [Nevskiales bacterium]PWN57380.1 cell division protein FtsB [Abyssibacter profundi]
MGKAALIAGLLILGYFQYRLWFADGGIPDVRRQQAEIADMTETNARLRARNEALQAEVDDLKSGVAAMEGRARTDLGMVRRDETFYLLVSR